MRLAGRLSLLGLVAVLAACGSNHARRDAVDAYFSRVNAAEANLLASIGEIDNAFHAFSLRGNTPAEVGKLAHAQAEIGAALASVRGLNPPADAAKIHADLVHLLSLEHAVAHELYWTTQFQPAYERRLSALNTVSKSFLADLKQVGAPAANGKPPKLTVNAALDRYATAFGSYGTALTPIVSAFDRMSAPPELRPAFTAVRTTLRRNVVLSTTIAADLHARQVTAANAAIRALFESAAGVNGAATQRAIRRAVTAYEARLRQIATLTAQVAHERQELVAKLG